MRGEHRSIRTMLTFFAVFAFGGFLHVFFYGVDWTTSLFQLYYCIVVLLWGSSIQRRIVEKRIRVLMEAIVVFLILFFVLQAGRFAMFNYAPVARRYLWYMYYVVYAYVPCFFLQAALEMNFGEEDKLSSISISIFALATFECLLIMTNDLHRMFLTFPDGIANADSSYKYGLLYYYFLAMGMASYIAAIVIIFFKCRVKTCRKMIWMPIVFSVFGFTGIILSFVGGYPKINGIRVWADGEIFLFLVIGVIESCIDMGLIPSNMYYNSFFSLVNDPVLIRGNDGEIRYATRTAALGIEESDDKHVYTKNISGGTVSYGVDISALNKLNRDLDEATERIKIRNEYLAYQNDLKEEQLKLQTRNGIYDKIATIVKPELEITLKLSKSPEGEDFNKRLAKIAFYNAYIKRRSNMELLCADSKFISAKELSTAISESIEYLKLNSVRGMARITGWEELPSKMVILFYEFFQYVTEKCIDSLSEIFVTLRHKEGRYTLNLVLKTEENDFDIAWKKEELMEYIGIINVSYEEDGTVVSISMEKGGCEDDDIR